MANKKNAIQKYEVVNNEIVDMDKIKEQYPEYFALSNYHKKCLVATNYWRVINGKPIIEVPLQYAYYHKYFDKRFDEIIKIKNK